MSGNDYVSGNYHRSSALHPDAIELAKHGAALPLSELLAEAERMTLAGFGRIVSYSRKVFIPLTHLCRDVCHYCTFARAPRRLAAPYLSLDQVLEIARQGAAAGCAEALFTLGDKPELRYRAAREALDRLGYGTTLDYLEAMARAVHVETGLLPHLNPGVMTREDLIRLRGVSVSMGLMLESSAPRLALPGQAHYGSPDKHPATRLEMLRVAGEIAIPMTSGILVGIGETREERVESLLALRDLHERYGHLQEIIIQNFRAKAGTKMHAAPEPSLQELQWTIAVARLIFGQSMSIQAPPNLQPAALAQLIKSGINDWGGVSPVTPDYVNPEAPWPTPVALSEATRGAGRVLVERLAITPRYAREASRWVDDSLRQKVLEAIDACGYRREDSWHAGADAAVPPQPCPARSVGFPDLDQILARATRGEQLSETQVVRLFEARGDAAKTVFSAADELRRATVGETVTYVVNRNINYTNVCLYRCGFCAFSKGGPRSLRGPGYLLDLDEVAARASEAVRAGATEVCLQGGIHPQFTGATYLDIVATIKRAQPRLHVHAFSPLEVMHGAKTLGLRIEDYLVRLRAAGLSTLPGTAAEILDDEVRRIICPDKVTTAEWLTVVGAAHAAGLSTTSTIMFGHVEEPRHWARHLLALRRLAAQTGRITEFVPLPYVHMQAPLWRRGLSRTGPTYREATLMHAVGRLVLHPFVRNIQTSWVKMGPAGAAACLSLGANDLGGTLMNESITRAAGGKHGQEFGAEQLVALAASIGRAAAQRTTLYGMVSKSRPAAQREVAHLLPAVCK
jgi:FO synthase